MQWKRGALISVLAFGLAGCQSHPASPDKAQLAALIKTATAGKGVLDDTFAGPSGLTGLVVKGPNGEGMVVWATPDGQNLLVGSLLDAQGRNQTVTATEAYLGASQPKSATSQTSAEFLAATRTAAAVYQGAGDKTLYVYVDPNCIFCHKLAESLMHKTLPAGVRIAWIPVGFLKPDSTGKGAAILAGGWDAFVQNEQGYVEASESGGVTPSTDAAAMAQVTANTELLRRTGRVSTPTLVYQDVKQGAQVVAGMPDAAGIDSILASIAAD